MIEADQISFSRELSDSKPVRRLDPNAFSTGGAGCRALHQSAGHILRQAVFTMVVKDLFING